VQLYENVVFAFCLAVQENMQRMLKTLRLRLPFQPSFTLSAFLRETLRHVAIFSASSYILKPREAM